jgi:Glycosyltransferase family 87
VRQLPRWPYTWTDFITYYNASLAVRHGADPYVPVAHWIHSYKPGQGWDAVYYVYTPAFALLLIPLTYLPYPAAFLIWEVCSVACLVGAVYCCIRVAALKTSLSEMLLLAAAASLWIVVRLEYNWGEADIFVLLFVAAAFWARFARGPVVAGVLLAIACSTKVPMLALVLFLLWKREFKFALSTIAAFLVMLIGPFVVLGAQAWRDQLTVWQFWSTQYVAFIDNQSPKGVLARLFTINPHTHPILLAPGLVTVLWLAIVAAVALIAAAVVRPCPLERDIRSLMELGVAITAMLLASPLTEYIYTVLLVIPMLGVYALVRQKGLLSPSAQRIAAWLFLAWLVPCMPIQHIEFYFGGLMGHRAALDPVFDLLAPTFLYVMIGVLALQLYALRQVSGRPVREAIRRVIVDAPVLGQQWMAHSRAAFVSILMSQSSPRQS